MCHARARHAGYLSVRRLITQRMSTSEYSFFFLGGGGGVRDLLSGVFILNSTIEVCYQWSGKNKKQKKKNLKVVKKTDLLSQVYYVTRSTSNKSKPCMALSPCT